MRMHPGRTGLAAATMTAAVVLCLAETSNAGLDNIGPDTSQINGNTFFTSMLAPDFPQHYWVVIDRFVPKEDVELREIWGVFGGDSAVNWSNVISWRAAVWTDLNDVLSSPLQGTVVNYPKQVPDLGSLTVPFGAWGGGPAYLVGMDIPDIVLQKGQEYHFGIYTRNHFGNNGLIGVVESTSSAPTGIQLAGPQNGIPNNWHYLNQSGFSNHNGVPAYKLVLGAEHHGAGCPGSNGITPTLDATGCFESGGDIEVTIADGIGNSVALLLLGAGTGTAPLGFGCNLHIAPLVGAPIGPLPLSSGGPGDGAVTLPGTIPTLTATATLTMQAFVVDPGVTAGFAATDAVTLRLAP